MNVGELKEKIVSLGFEETSILTDSNYTKVIRDGINRALRTINAEFPLIGTYELSLDGSGTDVEEINFADVSDFDVLLNATIKETVNGRAQVRPFANFQVYNDSYVYVSQTVNGDILFYYRKKITPITTSTADNVTVDVHYKAEELIPLLASYYIWEDDSPEKAAKWKNEYEDARAVVLGTSQVPKPLLIFGGVE